MAAFSTRFFGRWPRAGCRGRGPQGFVGRLSDRIRRHQGTPASLAGALLAFLFLSATPGAVSSQTVQGQLLDRATGVPVEGALVLLLNAQGEQAAGYLTNTAGRFLLRVTDPGIFTLRSERIGYETIESDPFELARGQVLHMEIGTGQAAVELEGITVEGEQQCVVRPGEGLEVARVWEEARKALTVQEWTDGEGLYRFRMLRYERDLDPNSLLIRSEETQAIETVSGNPIRSLPVDQLLRDGFILPAPDGGYFYYGPDASVLLSDEFLDTHCFRLRTSRERPGAVGLSFEPVRKRSAHDIEGTLWLDRETAKLLFLEYGYDWAPWEEAIRVAGGRVEFEEMPNGAWIIRKWWIRMPVGARRFPGAVDARSSIRIIGITEAGGEVQEISSPTAATISTAARGLVTGHLRDNSGFAAPEMARVFLSGTSYSSPVDREGAFVLEDVPGGLYLAAFSHPMLDSLGVFPPGKEVRVVPEEAVEIGLSIPSVEGILSALCGGSELGRDEAVVTGLVRRGEEGAAVRGATVTLEWRSYSSPGGREILEDIRQLQVSTDERGRYRACGVPVDVRIRAQASYLDWRGVPAEIAPSTRPVIAQNLRLDPRGDRP